jgi:beta-lactamase class A
MLRAALAAAALALPAAPPTALAAPPDAAGVEAAREYAATRPGTVALAVRTSGTFMGVDQDRAFPSASVLKAMLLVAYARQVRGRPLRAAEKRLLDPMIRRSDNAATNVIFTRVGTDGLRRLAKAARMSRFRPASPIWGNSRITARDQTRLFLRIDALLPARHRAYGLKLLRTVVPSQRWGIGRLELPDWQVYFKGGWGAGTGAVDHQVALLVRGEERVALAVLTADNGSHAAGKATLEGVFRRLLQPSSSSLARFSAASSSPRAAAFCSSSRASSVRPRSRRSTARLFSASRSPCSSARR